jgi:hypothetical protein
MRLKRTTMAGAVVAAAVTGVAAASGGALPDLAPEAARPAAGTVVADGSVTREGHGPARVVVRRGVGAPAGFTWTTRPRSATAADFEPRTGRLQFQAGQHKRVLTIPVRDDTEREGPQVFEVRLDVRPGLSRPRGPVTATVWILDGP